MAIAVINHADLVAYADKLGFPKYTKVKLLPEGYGYKMFDEFIRANVRWVNQMDVDPLTHVPITESANHVGEIPDPWAIRCQKYLEGTEEHNSFKHVYGKDIDGEAFDILTHVNRAAIQVAVSTASFRYQVDYKYDGGAVEVENFLNVAIHDTPEDSSLSYSSNLMVEQLWTTDVRFHDDDEANSPPVLYKRAYFNDPVKEESHPWVMVGELTPDEDALWREHNCQDENTLENLASTDFRGIDERVARSMKATVDFTNSLAYIKNDVSTMS